MLASGAGCVGGIEALSIMGEKASDPGGWYWYRDASRDDVVLHVFDPLGNKHWKAWDRRMLREIAGYEGEWCGPVEVPK